MGCVLCCEEEEVVFGYTDYGYLSQYSVDEMEHLDHLGRISAEEGDLLFGSHDLFFSGTSEPVPIPNPRKKSTYR